MKQLFTIDAGQGACGCQGGACGCAGTPTEGVSLIEAVQERYTRVAERGASHGERGAGCCGDGGCGADGSGLYTTEELAAITSEAAAASAGCGNPVGLAEVRPGETVLDLGSGGGIDCFLAAQATGPEGTVIGVDMTPAMVALARENAGRLGTTNVTFKLGHIEAIPEPDATVDLVISNCVIALAPDKDAVFADVYRVLKPGGRIVVSDMVTDQELPEDVRMDAREWVSCVGGADLKSRYLERITSAGFGQLELLKDVPMPAGPGREWASSVRSVTVRAVKPAA